MQDLGATNHSQKQNEEDKKKYDEFTNGFDSKNNLAVEFLGKRTHSTLFFMVDSFAQENHKKLDRFIYRRKPSLLKYIHDNINEFKEFIIKSNLLNEDLSKYNDRKPSK